MSEKRTPTETLVAVLEDFGRNEPTKVIVIYTNEEGDINWSQSSPVGFSEVVGMLECVKAMLLKQFCDKDNES